MADNENVWTQEIEDEELGQLLTKAATTGHPEWAYHVRHGLAKGTMSEGEAKSYLEEQFEPKDEKDGDDGDDDDDDAPAPAKATATTKKAPAKG